MTTTTTTSHLAARSAAAEFPAHAIGGAEQWLESSRLIMTAIDAQLDCQSARRRESERASESSVGSRIGIERFLVGGRKNVFSL